MDIQLIAVIVLALAYLAWAVAHMFNSEIDSRPRRTLALLQALITLTYLVKVVDVVPGVAEWLSLRALLVASLIAFIGGIAIVIPAVRAIYSAKPVYSRTTVLFLIGSSVGMLIGSFGAIYAYLPAGEFNLVDEKTKAALALDLGTGLYFSLVTFATVGYGDIVPVGGYARLAVSAEIALSMLITVFVFSVVASFLRQAPKNPKNEG